MVLPIHPLTKPSTLQGLENGKLPASVLRSIPLDDGQTVLCEITAARAFEAAFAQARKDLPGLKIRHVGGYRTYEGQLSLFLSRYKPVSYAVYAATSSSKRKYWPQATSLGYSSNYWIKSGNYATAAVPGTSNHGWALAIDIAENTDADYTAEGITARFVNWLSENGWKYGISAELQSEPWHWRYYTGDNVPQAVLDYENVFNPQPPLPGDDDDMIYLDEPRRIYDSRVHKAPKPNYNGSGDPPLEGGQTRSIEIPFAERNPDGTGGMDAVQVNVTVITPGDKGGHITVTAGNIQAGETSDLNWNPGEGARNMQMDVKVDPATGLIKVTNGPTRVTHLVVDWKAYKPL